MPYDERRSFRDEDSGYGQRDDGYAEDDGYGDRSHYDENSQYGSEYGSQYDGYGRGRESSRQDDAVSDVSDREWVGNDEYDPEQEQEQEQPRFKYSTANIPTDQSSRNTKCCLIAMCVLCIIVAIVVTILLNKLSAKEDPREETDSPTMAPVDASVPGNGAFLSTTAFVAAQCGAEKWNGADKATCQKTCDAFDACCDPYDVPRNQSCLLRNREGCLNYSPCHVVNNRVDPVPENIERVCALEQVQQDDTLCRTSCNSVECCFAEFPQVSCRADNLYACLDYGPCQNLRIAEKLALNRAENVTDDHSLVPLPDRELIQRACVLGEEQETERARVGNPNPGAGNPDPEEECAAACAPADCCFQTHSESCLDENWFVCLEYRGCPGYDKFRIPFPGDRIKLPPPNVSVICSEANFRANVNGTDDCEDACAAGKCCLLEGGQNCFSTDPFSCLKYEPCRILPDLGGFVSKNDSIVVTPPAEEDVNGTDPNPDVIDGNSTIPDDTNSTDLDDVDGSNTTDVDVPDDDTNSTMPDDDDLDGSNSTVPDANSTVPDDDMDDLDGTNTTVPDDDTNSTSPNPNGLDSGGGDDTNTTSPDPDDDTNSTDVDAGSESPTNLSSSAPSSAPSPLP